MKLEDVTKLHDEDKLIGKFDLSNEVYHACPGVSSSFLNTIISKSLAHAKYKKEHNEPTEAMEFGSLCHMAILEPNELSKYYREVPSTDKRRKDVLAIYAVAELEGWIPISEKTMQQVREIRESLFSTKTGHSLFSNGVAEQAYFARDIDTGLLIKAKPDYINTKAKILIDLKTIDHADIWNIKNKIRNLGYNLQASFYMDIVNQAMKTTVVDAAVWVFIEKTAPYGVRFVQASAEQLQNGFNLYKNSLAQYKEAMETGIFSGYEDSIITIDEKEGA